MDLDLEYVVAPDETELSPVVVVATALLILAFVGGLLRQAALAVL